MSLLEKANNVYAALLADSANAYESMAILQIITTMIQSDMQQEQLKIQEQMQARQTSIIGPPQRPF